MLAALLLRPVPVAITGSGVERLRQHHAGVPGVWVIPEEFDDDEEIAEALVLIEALGASARIRIH